MSLRRDSNREPAPVPASIATDRLSAVLHAGLRFSASNTTTVATETAQGASLDPKSSRRQKLETARRYAATASRDIQNSNENQAIRYLDAAHRIAEEIKQMQPVREAQDVPLRAPTQPPSGTGDQTGVLAYLATGRLASWYADAAGQRFVDELIDEAIKYLMRAKRAVRKMKMLKVERPAPSHAAIYSSDDGL